MMSSRRGLALLVVVGTLGVLAVLGVAFASMAQLERRASLQRVHAAKAELLARSGIEDALARLALGQDPAYGGEDLDGDRILDAGAETTEQVYRPGLLDTDDCPPGQALRPSFFVNDGTGTGAPPALERLEGRLRGCSGRLSGDLRPRGNQYVLRVAHDDGIFVNGGDPAADPTQGYNPTLRRMLGTLARALDWYGGGSFNGVPVGQADGFNLVDLRPRTNRGWESLSQIRDRALGGSQAKLEALRPYLVLEAWVDRRVIRPNPNPANPDPGGNWGTLKLGHLQTGPDSRAPALEPRSPVSLEWARSRRPVLAALLAGLQGQVMDPESGGIGSTRILPWIPSAFCTPGDELGVCDRLVEAIAASTSELDTWERWNAFCDTLPVRTLDEYGTPIDPFLIQMQRDLLKANFNPNSDLNKFNPNRTLWKHVDKSDLQGYSTEFSLESMNGATLSCEGRILSPGGRVLARRTETAVLSPPKAVRITTQREFAASSLGSLELPGDEGAPRIPGSATVPYVSRNGSLEMTWGHRVSGNALNGFGAALQSYPEPHTGATLALNAAGYDGNLQLATIETRNNVFYSVTAVTADMKLLASFDTGFDLDLADGASAVQTDVSMVGASELGNSLLHATKPSTLYPDGAYSETGRTPAYLDAGNAHGFHAALSFWVKMPHVGKASYEQIPFPGVKQWSSRHCFVDWTHYGPTYDPAAAQTAEDLQTQLFCLADGRKKVTTNPFGFACVFEIRHDWLDINECTDLEHLHVIPPRAPQPNRWQLLTVFWDFLTTVPAQACRLGVDAGTSLLDWGQDSYPAPQSGLPPTADDITLPDFYGPHRISLGGRHHPDSMYAYFAGGATAANATFDEFVLYDFGTNASTAGVLAVNRYREGRYYKGSGYESPRNIAMGGVDAEPWKQPAASYYSPPIVLPAGSTLRQVAWTWYRPQELPTDYAELELVNTAMNPTYLWSEPISRSTLAPGWARDRQAWDIGRSVSTPFRLRVVFRREIPVDLNTPILDSPVLDDLTLFYTPSGGPRISAWRGGG